MRNLVKALVVEGAARPTSAVANLARKVWSQHLGVSTFLEQAAKRADSNKGRNGKEQCAQAYVAVFEDPDDPTKSICRDGDDQQYKVQLQEMFEIAPITITNLGTD